MSVFLIADDSDAKAMWLEAVVEKSGIAKKVIHARTTDEAKAMIDKEKITYAFIDYEMPTEEGPAVIFYLKEKRPGARVALVSSSNSSRYQEEAKNAGAEAYICTSFEEDAVIESINAVLSDWST